jgi:hypothetical protein
VLEKFGSLDILIHNAGGSGHRAEARWFCPTRIGKAHST